MDLNPTGSLIDGAFINKILKPRDPFSHKGDYGHACVIAGSIGLMGAAVLAAKACLRSGAGKVTAYTASIGYNIMQICVPEAMTKIAGEDFIFSVEDIQRFDSIGLGPGLGLYETHKDLLKNIFSTFQKPMVIDADALNILSKNKELLTTIPAESILTPHIMEFERLFGKTRTDAERVELALKISYQYKIYIVVKGHHTLIATPDKKKYFNSTGNPGMATGGSGDVLTGVLTGLLAQGYSSLHACLLGVYLHGLAGDIAAEKYSQQAMIAGDIIDCLGEAFKTIEK
ncbi:MAG: NAD(P)H-hydrate dehydratase [Chitinophagaceae bacterium]